MSDVLVCASDRAQLTGLEHYEHSLCGGVGEALRVNCLLSGFLRSSKSVVLVVGDDIQHTPDAVAAVLASARATGAASAVYPSGPGVIAAAQMQGGKWMAGLGFCAFARERLEAYAARLESLPSAVGSVLPFCQEGPSLVDGERPWRAAGFWLSEQLGGVELLSVSVGLRAQVGLTVDPHSVQVLLQRAKGDER